MKTRLIVGGICLMFLMMVVPASGYAAAGQSGWQAPMPVGWYDDAVDNKAMAINGAGEILAVMSTQREGSSFNSIASALYLPGQGWSQLSDMGGGNFIVQNLRVVADGVGNFYATYSLDVSTTESAFSAQRFNHSAGWHDDMTLQYDAGYTVSSVRLAADDNGNAIVVWVSNLQSFPYTNEVVSCSYTAATGWGSQLAVRGASPYTPESLTVSAFRNGNAAVAWVEVVDGSHNLRLSRYVPISGWTVVQTLVATISYTEIIGMGFTEAGTGLLAWSQSMNPRQVFYKSFNGTSWTGARLVGNDSLIENAQMAFNPSGQAMLVWSNGSAGGGLHYASYAPASGWTAVASGFQIEAQLEFGFTALYLSGNGHALLIYEKTYYHENSGYFSRGFASPAWGEETQIARADFHAFEAAAAFGPQGMAVLSWKNTVSSRTAMVAAIYIPAHMPAPSLIVWSPQSGDLANEGIMLVTGITDPGARISVNGMDAYVDAFGEFSVIVPLAPGNYVLTVTVTGAYGNSQSTDIPVRYVDAAQQQMQNDINKLNGQGTLYLLLGLIALIVAVVAIVLLLMRNRP